MQTLAVLRTVWVLLMLAWGLLAVFRMPTGLLFYATVAATEAGYLLALLTLPAFVGGVDTPRDIVLAAVGAATVVLLLSPLGRVGDVARALPADLSRAFGESSARPPRRSAGRGCCRSVTRACLARPSRMPHPPMTASRCASTSTGAVTPPSPRPLVLIIHGGSWRNGDRTQLPSMAKRLAAAGYVVAAIDYRLAPTHRFPAAHDDVRAAVDYLREHASELGIDPERVVLYGRSAGGHLALLAAYRWHAPFVRGVVALYPPTDLAYSWAHPTNPRVLDTHGTLRAFLGGAPSESDELAVRYREASPYAWATAESPPTLLVHGGRDELVRPVHSERLAQRLDTSWGCLTTCWRCRGPRTPARRARQGRARSSTSTPCVTS
jgi:acetyl esterase/lipase